MPNLDALNGMGSGAVLPQAIGRVANVVETSASAPHVTPIQYVAALAKASLPLRVPRTNA